MEWSMIKSRKRADSETAATGEPWGALNWLANGKLLGTQNLTVGRVLIRRGQQNPRHAHPGVEEVLYLLSGRLEHTVGDERVILEPGDTLLIPAGAFHNAKSIGQADADMIVAYPTADRSFVLER
jgi:quercetin dioxygenase-like cupin family protein